ncbi:phage gp6-like head-tail connector protein [Actinospongicola halichondriae]|uniref:phage gp6-like head-tail connector protein n=1 Tax=Actinospongicola halichondriae TaxID=3236844 RepID=UPI003D3C4C11
MAWNPQYCTNTDLKKYLRIPDVQDDGELSTVIDAASRAIDYACNRQFGKTDDLEQRTYKGHRSAWDCTTHVNTDDIADLTDLTITVDGTTVDPDSDLTWYPYNSVGNNRPYQGVAISGSHYPAIVQITATWGWTAVPEAIKSATLLQASRFFARRQSPYGIAGSPEMGNELRLLNKIDPDVAVIVAPYRRVWAVA